MYVMKVWKHHQIVDVYATENVEMLQRHYDENWKWPDYDGDCYCEVEVDGKLISVEESYDLLQKVM